MDFSKFKDSTLIPIDFTENSLNALIHARDIAHIVEHKNHKLTLLHVLEGVQLDQAYIPGEKLPKDINKSLLVEGAENRIKKIIEENLPNLKDEVQYIIDGGKVYRKIAQIAKQTGVDSIVMGTHGASGFQGLLGSNAARVIQTAPCPTVVASERFKKQGYQNIVLPLDLTKETKQKVSWAQKVAKYFNSTIHILTITEEDEFLAHRINANLNQVETYLKNYGIKTTSSYITESQGNFTDATLKFAKDKDADLIIIMTQQEKSFSEYLFGTYAQRLISKSTVPIMCINPRSELGGKVEISTPGYGID